MLRVAVVGSGPSGCYTAQSLVQLDPEVRVDVLDRLPCPYGLVRYGVAPDHEKIKSLQNNLRSVLEHERVRFLGGVQIGPGGVPAERLRELYHAVVYCVGAATDRHLGIPGEELPGSWSATQFVSWYSAHPDAGEDGFVRDVRSAVVIGVGNVAVDVTRMLARGAAELSPTDMPQAALTALAASRVSDIHMVGRRGPSQARFTTKELRELNGLPGAEVTVDPAELTLDPAYTDPSALPAAQRRNVEVLKTWANATQTATKAGLGPVSGTGAGADAGTGAVARAGAGAGTEADGRSRLEPDAGARTAVGARAEAEAAGKAPTVAGAWAEADGGSRTATGTGAETGDGPPMATGARADTGDGPPMAADTRAQTGDGACADDGVRASAGAVGGVGPMGRGGRRSIALRFFLRPVELLADGGRVGAVRFERTVPDWLGGVVGTGRFEEIEAQLVLRSVGYRGVQLEGLPFDAEGGTVPHLGGRVLREGVVAAGEYVAGWIKRGPTGVIGTNRPDAKETATSLLEDAPVLAARRLPGDPLAVLRAGGVEPVPWTGWQAIERAEAALGASLGRSVVKLADWESLLAAARTPAP